ncbi:MAG: winged helix-turn-helix domain-containing protein [Pyrinomonadaceae bacterium]
MSSGKKHLYEFGDFFLDSYRRVLLRGGQPVPLTPKVFDTLLILVEERDRPIPNEELIKRVWPDTAASKNNLDQNVFLLRKALGDSASEWQYIETVSKIGYRFVAEVSETAGGSPELTPESDVKLNSLTVEERLVALEKAEQVSAEGETPGADGSEWAVSKGRSFGEKIKAHKIQAFLFVAALTIALAGSLYGLSKLVSSFKRQPRAMKIARITGTEQSVSAAISSDGKYVAHVIAYTNQQRLELRQLATNSNVVLVPPAAAGYFGLTFSRDGNHVYFIRQSKDEPTNTLYRIPTLGGDAKRISAAVDSPVSFSPDGRHFAFIRNLRQEQTSLKGTLRESALIVADAETAEERVVRKRIAPDFFSDAGPSWSPDGKVIACPAGGGSSGRDTRMTVVGVDAADGTERPITTRDWFAVRQLEWLPDGGGLISVAEELAGWAQVWHLTYPGGEARKITNDLDNYSGVSLAADSDALITIRTEARFNLWVAPGEDFKQVKQITFGGDHVYRRLAWAPDGRIVFPSTAMGSREIWIMGADGTGHKQLTFDKGSNLLPSVSPDGRYIVFASDRGGNHNVWRIDIDGANPKQLTDGEQDFGPRVSPDGRWVLYTSAASGKETMWRVPIDGGEIEQVIDQPVVGPDVSPDGKLIASWYKPSPDSPRKIAIFPWAGGEPIKVFDALPPQVHPVRWNSDGRSLIYIVTRNSVSNLWMQPVDGSTPQQLTDFKSEVIEGFDVSREGKLVCSRGYTARDVVLISDFR